MSPLSSPSLPQRVGESDVSYHALSTFLVCARALVSGALGGRFAASASEKKTK
jgi:hypothetical protein